MAVGRCGAAARGERSAAAVDAAAVVDTAAVDVGGGGLIERRGRGQEIRLKRFRRSGIHGDRYQVDHHPVEEIDEIS